MKRFLQISFCVCALQPSFAQAPDIEWQQVYGGSDREEGSVVVSTPDGGFILAGSSISGASYNKTEGNIGGSGMEDFWVLKIDHTGIIEAQNAIGGNSADVCTALAATDDGGSIAGGYSISEISGDKTTGVIGPDDYFNDYWITKLDASTNIVWQKTIGGKKHDYLYSIQQTEDGGYIIGGSSGSPAGGDKTEGFVGATGKLDYWIIKTDAFGNIEWQNTIGGDHDDHLCTVQQTGDGGYIVGGYSNSQASGDKSESNSNGNFASDLWILKLSGSGTIEWQNTIGGPSIELLTTMKILPDGNFIIGGHSNSDISTDKSEPSTLFDCWLIKLSASGSILWEKTIEADDNDGIQDIAVAVDGLILCAVSGSVAGLDKTEGNYGEGDYWIMKLDFDGNMLWQKVLGGSMYDNPTSIVQCADGGYAITGESLSPISGNKSEDRHGPFFDFWLVKLEAEVCPIPTDVYTDNITTTKASIFWNPIPDADLYQIWYRPAAGGTWLKKSSTTNMKTIKSLLPETEYMYKVRTKCTDGSFGAFTSTAYFTTLPLREHNAPVSHTVQFFPNPATTTIHITLAETDTHVAYRIMNMHGQTVLSGSIHNDQQQVDVSDLSAGMYFIDLIIGTERSLQKLTIVD